MNQFERNIEITKNWHYIKRKLRTGDCLSKLDRQMLLALLELSEEKTIPSNNDIKNYRNHYLLFITTDKSAEETIKDLFFKILYFETKYVEILRHKRTIYKEG